MSVARWWLIPVVLVVAPFSEPRSAAAQNRDEVPQWNRRGERQPVIFAFVLRQAGESVIDPSTPSGRHEVLQLMASRSPLRGQFRRARMDRLGSDVWSSEGWYEIRGNTIQLYHRDAQGGATGRVEIGRYLENTICLSDQESGELLAFEYLSPAVGESQPATRDGDPVEFVGPARIPDAPDGCSPLN